MGVTNNRTYFNILCSQIILANNADNEHATSDYMSMTNNSDYNKALVNNTTYIRLTIISLTRILCYTSRQQQIKRKTYNNINSIHNNTNDK